MVKSYVGNPYYGSNRKARIFTSMRAASKRAIKVNGRVYQIGSKRSKIFVVQKKGAKYYIK